MFRLSLRELLALVAFVAVAIVSLKYANQGWQVAIVTLTLIMSIGGVIAAVVDRGPRQAWATGMIIGMVIYGSVVASGELLSKMGSPIFRQRYLPTTHLLLRFRSSTRETRLPDSNPDLAISGRDGTLRPSARSRFRQSVPDERHFLSIGHLWWTLLIGYLGGRFAQFVYTRRIRELKLLASESS